MTKPELAQYAKQDGTGRAYKHPFRTLPDGKPLTAPSITTILGLVDKPALIQWAANQTITWAVDNASLLFTKERESAIRSGKWRWQDVRDERAEVGTGIHETIEALHTGAWNFPVLDAEQKRIMDQWELLNERYLIVPHRSEFTVFGYTYDPTRTYAGTGDGLWDITDQETGIVYENMVIDLKTSKNTWPEHWLQLSALFNGDVIMEKQQDGTWLEITPPQYGGTAIIHLRDDYFKVTIEQDLDLIDMQFNQFMSYRMVWDTKKAVELYVSNREKTEEMAFR